MEFEHRQAVPHTFCSERISSLPGIDPLASEQIPPCSLAEVAHRSCLSMTAEVSYLSFAYVVCHPCFQSQQISKKTKSESVA